MVIASYVVFVYHCGCSGVHVFMIGVACNCLVVWYAFLCIYVCSVCVIKVWLCLMGVSVGCGCVFVGHTVPVCMGVIPEPYFWGPGRN